MKSFIRGQKSKLSDLLPGDAFQIAVNLVIPAGSSIDVSCFGLDAADKLSDDRYFVFFNQRASPDGAITAAGAGNGALETFSINLARLSTTISKLVFTATLDGTASMAQIQSGWLRVLKDGATVAEFPLIGSDYSGEKAIVVGELYRKDLWRFAAVGQGFNGGLSALLKHFGGEEIAAPAPAAKPASPTPPASTPPPLPAVAPVSLKKVTLEKQGERRTLTLAKSGASQPIQINLNWDRVTKRSLFGKSSEADLDLGCMFQMRDGTRGVIQALGGNFGSKSQPPFIYLDKDDRSGSATDGENLFVCRPDLIQRVMVFAFIYEGTANFSTVNGRLVLRETDGQETLIRLNAPDPRLTFCSICLIEATSRGVEVSKEERYFRGHPDADHFYQFGFSWSKGSK
ncbi:MAG: TerD family protein [Verrucomicrobiota bacterium]